MITRRSSLAMLGLSTVATQFPGAAMASSIAVIDDFSVTGASASNAGNWRYVADTVMGGVSRGKMTAQTIMGRPALRMTGAVSTDNNGGFIQIALNLGEEGQVVEASAFKGFEIDAIGNREEYNIHLRTTDLRRSWESYRASFALGPKWQTFTFAFADFDAYRALKPLDPAKLRSIGIVAIGREFEADVAVGGVRLYA